MKPPQLRDPAGEDAGEITQVRKRKRILAGHEIPPDVEVYEDGVLQTVDSFRFVDIPLPPRTSSGRSTARSEVPRDVTSNPVDSRSPVSKAGEVIDEPPHRPLHLAEGASNHDQSAERQ